MTEAEPFVVRTDQKLRFAQLVIDELNTPHPNRNSGDDFERSHYEAFFFHFYGAIDAFLQELNIYYDCGLSIRKVTCKELKKRLKDQNKQSVEFSELELLLAKAPDGYLAVAQEIRHYVTHRGGLSMTHYFNGPTYFVDPTTQMEFNVKKLESWLSQLKILLGRLRNTATTKKL